VTVLRVVGAAIVADGAVLAARRGYPAEAAGRWEFPGGKAGAGEPPERALVREVAEELGCTVEVESWLTGLSRWRYGAGERELTVALCRLVAGIPRAIEHDELRWLGPEQLGDVDWLEPDRPFLAALEHRLLDGEPLPGGNVGGAVRIGDSVRRPTGFWTPAVHAVLAHLAESGVPAVPRVRGVDRRGREVLDYLPGEVIDVDHEQLSEARLASLGRWLARLHAAVAGFSHAGPWRFFAVAEPTLISHNDVAPYNIAFAGDEVSGVFDWDFAGPTTAEHDLGHTAWSAIPLFRPIPAEEAARRLKLFADSYGIAAETVLDAVEPRVRLGIEGIATGIAAGDPGMLNLSAVGEPERTRVALEGFVQRRQSIGAALTR